MQEYICTVGQYIYEPKKGDEKLGIKPGTSFEELPKDWKCPECGSSKEKFDDLASYILGVKSF